MMEDRGLHCRIQISSPMISISSIRPGDKLTNLQIATAFGCGNQGGMRRSLKTNTLVLISNHVNSIYDDRWIGGVLHYTGMGTDGPQALDFMQNKTLFQSAKNGVGIHLFEVFKDQEYVYAGRVALDGPPYKETQPDKNGIDRTVWVFPLKALSTSPTAIAKTDLDAFAELKQRQARKLTDAELLRRAQKAHKKPGQRVVGVIQHDRNPWVAEYAKRRAAGKCDLCESPAPFLAKDGSPYLECHHIVWLAKDGDDSVDNTVALCPNCHRKMHVIDLDADRKKLLKKYRQ